MDIQTIVIVAVAINIAIVVVAIFLPWFRDRRERAATEAANADRASAAAAARLTAPGEPATRSTATESTPSTGSSPGDGPDPGAPLFSERETGRGAGSANAVAPFAMDVSTGLDLSPAWARWLTEEDARIQRFHRPATVVLVELSGLDRLADRLGTEAAARLIPPIATTLRKDARATDHLARIGPTRFAALLTETTEVQAIHYVERVRSACDLWLEAGAVALRLSLGWAEIGPDRPADVAVLDAERRLFAEREKARSLLARQDDDPPPEVPALQSSSGTRPGPA
jgi:diguanylate cyclase (GGDEF)-like protein